MKKYSLFIIMSITIAGCNGNGGSSNPSANNPPTNNTATTTSIQQISTPLREHGYSNLNTMVIAEQGTYEAFLTNVEGQEHWNNKVDFQSALNDAAVDFNQHNLIIYTFNEGSGSIGITPQLPTQDGNTIDVEIVRNAPEIGTADMAYYALSYQVAKNIQEITFDNGKQAVVIENTASNNVIPKNCKVWFDGCNTCSRSLPESLMACTKRACPEITETSRCNEWFQSP